MRKITKKIVDAFSAYQCLKISNTRTDGYSIYLFENEIVRRFDGRIMIRTAGWNTRTTVERLNGLPGVRVTLRRGELTLNGQEWDSDWIFIDNLQSLSDYHEFREAMGGDDDNDNEAVKVTEEFDVTSEWMVGGYSKPIYSVFHTNNEFDLAYFESLFRPHSIPTRRMESDTEGKYKPNYFIVVKPNDYDKALNIIKNLNILF